MKSDKTRIALEVLITHRDGMNAENKQREFYGQSMAYTDDAFGIIANKIKDLNHE